MERDGVMGHGMSYFLNESFMIRGEKKEFYIAVCNKSGAIAIYNESRNLFLSPLVDGPIKFNINPDGSQSIMNISRFGRSFSILRVPYAFKLLIQELQVLNVQMRIITDENVDQLLSMSFSDNINKLTQMNKSSLREVVESVNLEVQRGIQKAVEKPRGTEIMSEDSESMSETMMPYNPIEFYEPEPPKRFNMQGEELAPRNVRIVTEDEWEARRAYAATIEPPPPFNIFQDPIMNAEFNMLNDARKSKILQMEPAARRFAMKQIMYNNGTQMQQQQMQEQQDQPRMQTQYQYVTDSPVSPSEVWQTQPGYDPQNTSSSPGYDPKNTPPTPPNNANSSILEVAQSVPQEENKPTEQSTSGGNNSSEIKKITL
jgi:hypothetical protein